MSSPFESPAGFQPPPPRRRIWPFALLGCAIFGFILLALCGGMMLLGYRQVSSGGDVAVEVDRLFEEIAQGRAADFYRTECAPELKEVTSQQEFVELADLINERLGKLVSKSVNGFSYKNYNFVNYVEADYECKFEHGDGSVHTKFKEENGRWLLMTFRVNSPELVKPEPGKDAQPQKCPHCGEPYEPGAKFCPNCGKELPAGEPAAEDEPTAKDEPSADSQE